MIEIHHEEEHLYVVYSYVQTHSYKALTYPTGYHTTTQSVVAHVQRHLEDFLSKPEASRFSHVFVINLTYLPVGSKLILDIPNQTKNDEPLTNEQIDDEPLTNE